MKLRFYLPLFMGLFFTHITVPYDYVWGHPTLKKYHEIAKDKENRRHSLICEGYDPVMLAMASTMVLTAAAMSNPAISPAAAKTSFGLYAALHAQWQYKWYTASSPYGFAYMLKGLEERTLNDKTVFIGGKEYLLDKKFNDIKNTGYISNRTNFDETCSAENQHIHQLISKKQYEIYAMPDDGILADTFTKITQALHNSAESKNIAFIALRPTPVLTNNAKQILPRIAIVLKENSSKQSMDNILKIAYLSLKKENDIKYIKASGYWPRYSEHVTFHDNAWNPVSEKLQNMFFVGIGNTDFKGLHHEQFERKKFLGITRNGDMVYPVNTPKSEKINTIIIDK